MISHPFHSIRKSRNQEHTDEMDTIFLSDVDVQEAFVVLKEAYDILSDPCLRQAYDNFGHYGS
jgi:DnaJ-class molecular chaperone